MSEPELPEYLRQSMVERVARAIADAFMEDYEEAPGLYDEMAAAGIRAMAVPTEAMVEAGRWPSEDDGPVACWSAMIDAALSPPPPSQDQTDE